MQKNHEFGYFTQVVKTSDLTDISAQFIIAPIGSPADWCDSGAFDATLRSKSITVNTTYINEWPYETMWEMPHYSHLWHEVSWDTTRKKCILEELPKISETEDMRKIG